MKFLEVLRKRLAELHEQRAATVAEMEAETAAAVIEGRSALTDEEAARFDAAKEKLDSVDKDIDDVEARLAELVEVDKRNKAARLAPIHIPDSDPLGEPRSIRDDPASKRLWDLNEVRADLRDNNTSQLVGRARTVVEKAQGVNARSKQRITSLLDALEYAADDEDVRGAAKVAAHIVAVSSPDYMRAWQRAMKSAIRNGQADPDSLSVLARAMSLTDAAGGFAVPLPVDPTLILNDDGSVNPFREIATQRTIVTDQLRTVNSTAVSFSWDGEAAEVSDDATTFANIDITVHKAQGFIPFSIEVSEDYPGFTEDIRMLLSDGRDNLEATAFATGTGTNQPIGIVTALTGGSFVVTSDTTDVLALGDIYDLDEELPSRFARNASWVANKKIYQAVREAGGANLDDFWVNLRDGLPPQLLGHRVYESSAMDGTVNALADNFVAVLGDFRFYWIVDRVGFSMELVPHLFALANNRPSGQRGFYAYWRVGADSVNDRAFRMLNVT